MINKRKSPYLFFKTRNFLVKKIIIMLSLASLFSQKRQKVEFEYYTVKDGLAENSVDVVLQDKQGFIWAGTENGLCRFDGYEFKVFEHNPFDSTTLMGNSITSLFQDNKERLWVGTNPGLNRYDPTTETFIRYPHELDNTNSIPQGPYSIEEDERGNIWCVGWTPGVYKLNPETGSVVVFNHDPNNSASLLANPKSSANMFIKDSLGNMWSHHGRGLNLIDPTNQQITHFTRGKKGGSISSDTITALRADQLGNLWIGTNKGLDRMDIRTKTFEYYRHDPNQKFSISNDSINYISENKDGDLWVSTNNGLNHFIQQDQIFIQYHNVKKTISSLTTKQIGATLQSRHFPYVWYLPVKEKPGVSRLNLNTGVSQNFVFDPTNPKSINDYDIRFIHEDKFGTMWFGTGSGGLNKLDPTHEKFTGFKHDPNDPLSLPGQLAIDIEARNNGDIYVSTENGIARYKPKSHIFDKLDLKQHIKNMAFVNRIYIDSKEWLWYMVNPMIVFDLKTNKVIRTYKPDLKRKSKTSLPHWNTWDALEDSRGDMWFAHFDGLSRLNPNGTTFTNYIHNPNDPQSIPRGLMRVIFEDSQNRFWIGTHAAGLLLWDRDTETYVQYQYNPKNKTGIGAFGITAISEDAKGRIWIGTWGGGLNLFNPETKTFTHYFKENGLPSNVISGIIPDNAGNLWLSTKNGISFFNSEKGTFKNFDEDDGLQGSEFFTGPYAINNRGYMYFGGSTGMTEIIPGNIRENTRIPAVVITDMKKVDRDGIQTNMDVTASNLNLSYWEPSFRAEFVALNFTKSEKNQYAYMLEGFDRDWVQAGSYRFANYTNLPPGGYTFRVKGSNNDGLWNEEGASVTVTVSPAPWQTWWAYLSYLILFGLSVFAYIRRQQRIHELEMEESRKTEELDLARQFQEDMLPKRMPDTPLYDVTAVIKTSTEVGGDYYDFFQQDDGSLYVVCGDATGHGMTAGMMVSITKAGLYGIPAIPTDQITNRLNRVIKNIELGTNRMALNVSYFQKSQVQFTSAGMPPAYHCVSSSGKVKEVLQVGLPLGSIQGEHYLQEEYPFDRGDTLVFLSDGLPEAENKSGTMLGYEAVMDCIRDNKDESVEIIKNSLLELGDNWLNGLPLQDDITIVVVKKK